MNHTGQLSQRTSLWLRGQGLSGGIPPWLAAAAPRLQALVLSDNFLTGGIPPELGDLSELRILELSRNGLSGPVPSRLGKLARLMLLYLYQNSLSGEIPPELARLDKLRQLSLSGNRLSGPIPPWLGNLTELASLGLWGNELSGQIPPELGSLGKLRELILFRNSLSGRVPPELGNLAQLTLLDLSDNRLAGPVPAQLGRLRELTHLSLSNNSLSGELPSELGGLGKLQRLILARNRLSGSVPPMLGQLTQLTHLLLFSNSLSGKLPSELGGLTQLTHLSLFYNSLTGELPSELGGLGKLQHLDISINFLSGRVPAELGNLSQLTLLDLSGNRLSGPVPAQLGSLPQLTHLSMSDNLLSGALPSELGGLGKLQRLGLARNRLSGSLPPELGQLARLTHLSLSNNSLSGRLPSELGSLARLQHLDLSRNRLEGALPAELGNLTLLTQLHLSVNSLGGEIPPELAGVSKLQELSLSRNRLSGSVPPCLANLTELVGLWLWDNALSGEIPRELGHLGKLQYLELSTNRLSGRVPPELGNLAQLVRLHLFKNLLSGELPVELGGLQRLERLDLSGNRLTGPVPPELGNLTQLVRLQLSQNLLSGELPVELGGLQRLEILDLSGNRLTGPVPPELGSLAELTGLGLSDNSLSGNIPPELGNLGKLRELALHRNSLSGPVPVQLGALSQLTGLVLWKNSLSGELPPELGRLQRLQHLDLSSNRLTGSVPPQLGNLTGLATLSLFDNSLSGALPPEIGRLGKLQRLDLSINRFSGPVPPELGDLARLVHLSLSENSLSGKIPAELARLSNLRQLNLYLNSLSGPLPAWLGGLRQLGGLLLWKNSLSGELPPELGSLDKLQQLDVSTNLLSGSIPPELGNLTQLTRLQLGSNNLTGAVPSELGGLGKLWGLTLSHNGLSGRVPPELGNLSRLTELQLNNNFLTGEIPPALGALSKLKHLHLHRNSLSGPVPPHLGNLSELTDLSLGYNFLSGEVPSELGGLHALQKLNLNSNRLSGPLPPALGNLTGLVIFRVGGNRLSGRLPPGLFASLPALQLLQFEANPGLTGDFPATVQAGALHTVSAAGCGFIGALALGPVVTSVDFRGNRLTAMPAAWQAHRRLKTLRLAHNRISSWPRRGVIPKAAFPWGPGGSAMLCNITSQQPAFVLPELEELEVSGNPLGPAVDARDFLFSLSYLPKLQELHARGCRLQGEPQAVDGQMQWLDGSLRCSPSNVLRPGFPSLLVWDMSDNLLQAVRASPPRKLRFVNFSFNALGSWAGAPGAAALHKDWWTFHRSLQALDARGNPDLRAHVQLPESGNCAARAPLRLAADPSSFKADAAARDGGLQHVECTKPCRMGYNLLVDPFSLNASALCRCMAGTAGTNLTCKPCPVGTHAQRQNPYLLHSTCRACPAGSSTLTGGRHSACDCKCAAGTYMTNATQCNAGGSPVVDPDSMRCSPCDRLFTTMRPGATSRNDCICDRSRNLVELGTRACGCAEGSFLNPAKAACERCPPGRSAARGAALDGEQGCRVTATFFLFLLCSALAGTGALVALPMALGLLPLHLRDVSLEEGRLVATTTISHGLLRWRPVLATFEGTGHPDLDFDPEKEPPPRFLLTASSGCRLKVLTESGEPVTEACDTSQGVIRISTRQALLSAGIWRVPAALVVLVLAPSFAVLEVAWKRPSARLLGDLAACVLLSLAVHTLRILRSQRTPLAMRLRDFGERLKEANPAPRSTSRGAGRGVTIGQLEQMYQFFEHFIGSRNMYYVCCNIVKPLTARRELSYADLAGPREINWFVSHYWGTSVRHFLEAIQKHAMYTTSDWRKEAYWICTFSINQWKLEEELGFGRWDRSSFYLALRSSACRATLMVVDSDVMPLKRAWCLFEVLQTMELRRGRADFAGLLLGTSSGVVNFGQSGMDVAMEVAKQVKNIDLREAEAFDPKDLEMIHRLVESRPGGFDTVNGFVRQEVCNALAATEKHVKAGFTELMGAMQDSLPGRASAASSMGAVPLHHLPVFPHGDDPTSPMAECWEGSTAGTGAASCPRASAQTAAAAASAAGEWLKGRRWWFAAGSWLLLVAAVAAFSVDLVAELA